VSELLSGPELSEQEQHDEHDHDQDEDGLHGFTFQGFGCRYVVPVTRAGEPRPLGSVVA
jgi:hypothetical protein